jgi:hypothetical protein
MTRFSAKATTLLAAAVLFTGAVAGCSKSSKNYVGDVALALTLPGGITVNTVSYTVVTAANAPLRSGTFSVTDPSATISMDLVLPPGVGDKITLSATSTSTPVRTFTGTATFTVTSGGVTMISVTLTDTVAVTPPGTVLVNGVIVPGNNPPLITSVVVAPGQTSNNASIGVSVTATDADGDTLLYAWTASPDGAFAAPAATTTTYQTPTGGTKTITITVTDTHGAVATIGLPVNIIGPVISGDGGSGGGGSGGGGMGGFGGEFACPAPQGESGILTLPAACLTCSESQCAFGAAGTDGCCAVTNPNDQLLCQAVARCFVANAPTCTSAGDGTNCFCGTSGGACFMTDGAANGPCTAPVIAAAKTTSAPAILGLFTSPSSPLGRGVNTVSCYGAFCSAECMVP